MSKFRKICSFIHIYLMLIIFDLELSWKGFNRTFEKFKNKYVVNNPIRSEAEFKDIGNKIFNFFDMLDIVCAWYPRKADCIHKTFLGYKVVRKKYKIPVDIVVGIRKFPFEAHAWLQSNNVNFFGDDEETKKYTIVLTSNTE
ncbi:lasso peptide biosynthesis B2 protein [Paenibacillus sp. SC116]|uniref:lasso peptide biosynthesis B2 protein n=1 Tax=Paenibacillus sp. SC116 TaxID=2968986 RepID=UPI00215ABCA2|nr:lasso peptide biosynthesis B2 protein [Paenibacillus sp. SC116]MCR8845068.1 lasso peptide biosynthesis B2 protein [Paenibacillus sp. SC116]